MHANLLAHAVDTVDMTSTKIKGNDCLFSSILMYAFTFYSDKEKRSNRCFVCLFMFMFETVIIWLL